MAILSARGGWTGLRKEGRFHDFLSSPCHPIGPGIGAGTDDGEERAVAKMQGHAVVGGIARGDAPFAEEAVVFGAAVGLAVVVRAIAAGEKAEAGDAGKPL
jgi:hypothetical protein